MASTSPAIRTIALSKSYGKRLAVDHLDLEVGRGELFGFLGPNGAGKTTTIRMALGLIAPTEGSVEILGLEVRSHRAQVLPRVGALVEAPALYGYLSGRDNLRAVGNLLGGASEKRIDEVLEIVSLKGRDRDRVKTYSLGMKQRLGIAVRDWQNRDFGDRRGILHRKAFHITFDERPNPDKRLAPSDPAANSSSGTAAGFFFGRGMHRLPGPY